MTPPTLLPRHKFAIIRIVFWLIMIGGLLYNLPGLIQEFRIFHGAPPVPLLILAGIMILVFLVGIGLGTWFEIQMARLPGDRASRSLYRAIESIAAQHADGDEMIDHAPDGTRQAHLTCLRTKNSLGFFRISASDIDRPLGMDDQGYTAADRIRLLPKVGAVQIRHMGARSYRAADGTLQHVHDASPPERMRTLLFRARTGAGIATHQELAELLAQLQRSSPIEA